MKWLLRVASLAFAVSVTGLLVARAAGCTTVEPASPTATPPPVMPTTPSEPGEGSPPPFQSPSAPTPASDAGPTAANEADAGAPVDDVVRPSFLPATKSGMPFLRDSEPTQAATP